MSIKQNQIDLLLELEHNWVHHPLIVFVKIDDIVLHLDVSGKKQIIIQRKLSLNDGQHHINIEVSKKNNKSIIIDDANNIIANSFVKIKRLLINDIDMQKMVEITSKFTDKNNKVLYKPGGIYDNGIWEFSIETPFYEWLLKKLNFSN